MKTIGMVGPVVRTRRSKKLISEMQTTGRRLKHLRGAGTNRVKALLRRMGL